MPRITGTGIGTVNVDWLNMRASPGGPRLALLKRGMEVQVVGRIGAWLDVWHGDLRGSVSSRYITMQPQVEALPPERPALASGASELEEAADEKPAFERQGEVTASQLNFRDAPNGHVLLSLSRGTQIKVLSESNGWMQVLAQGQKGYVSARFVRPSLLRRRETSPPLSPLLVLKQPRFEGDWAFAPDGKRFAKKFRKGVFSSGTMTIGDFIQAHRDSLTSVSPSQLRLLEAVSENEGKLEAINTWDNAYLSFGIFQWTAGVGSEAGELPGLLHRFQNQFPDAYEKYFGQYALTLSGVREFRGSPPRGYFKLSGNLLGSGEQKEVLRSLAWPYRFKQAGMDDKMRRVELEHAVARISCFLRVENRRVRGHNIGDYISSEYGIAQLLDQHVNRPAHVLPTVGKALDSLEDGLDADNPETWGDEEERRLLEAYLSFRAQTSMTDGVQRAGRILRQKERGLISDLRGSYQA